MVGAKAEACKHRIFSEVSFDMLSLIKVEEKFDLTSEDIERAVVRYHESCPNGTNIGACADSNET